MSRVLTPIDVRNLGGDQWLLLNSYACESDTLGRIDIKAGFVTDFNSVPRLFWNIVAPTEAGESALPHDQLYRKGANNGTPITRAQADAVHLEFLNWIGGPDDFVLVPQEDGSLKKREPFPAWKKQAMYRLLRLCGWKTWRRYRQAEQPA